MRSSKDSGVASQASPTRPCDESAPRAPEGADRRIHPRTRLSLAGRYMLEDGAEYACETVDVSPTGLLLKVEKVAKPGARVVAYIEGLGRVEGLVVRTSARGFALALYAMPRKTERLAQMIDWLAQSDVGEPRRHANATPEVAVVMLATASRDAHPVRLVDVSTAGVAFLTDLPLVVGEPVELGAQRGVVARLIPGGAAVSFV